MTVRSMPPSVGLAGAAIGLAGLALAVAACGNTPTPTQLPTSAPPASVVAPATPTLEPTAAPTPSPTPTPAATPTAAPSATPTPAASEPPSPSPSPATTTIDDYAWVYEKRPLTLKGAAGTTTWTKVLFAAKTVDLKWSATPASSEGCVFRYKVESSALSKTVSGASRAKGSKATTGSRGMTINYGDGKVTVTTDCAKFTLKAVSTSHPKLTIKQSNDFFKASGTTAADLNSALAKSWADWSFRTDTRYFSGPVRVSSHTMTFPLQYELPKWTPPDGTDPALVESWQAALKNMRRHVEVEAAIGIQAAGRYLAAADKKSFSSVSAMDRYYDKVSDRFIDKASERLEQYNTDTQYGYTQGGYIE